MAIDFTCRSFGKWILAGEHSVLRGSPALAFPIQSRSLELSYSRSNAPLELRLIGDHGNELQELVWSVLVRACAQKNISRSTLMGTLLLESSLPVGAGMGASAALCVALTRWLGFLGHVSESEYYEFARNLENLFHGESSGVDIAVALNGEGIKFLRDGERTSLKPRWQPKWYISYSGQRGVTLDAVNKVKRQLQEDPEKGRLLDQRMAQAVLAAEAALSKNESTGFSELVSAINLAGTCFEEWGLIEGLPQEHMRWLRQQGAVAVKPTGSGGGGYVLSLWQSTPSSEVLAELIQC